MDETIIAKLNEWIKQRHLTVEKLKKLADELDRYHTASTAGQVASSTLSICGTIVGVGVAFASLASFFAGGSAVSAGGVGHCVAIASQGVSFISKAVKDLKTSKVMKEIEETIEKDQQNTLEIKKLLDILIGTEIDILSYLETLEIEEGDVSYENPEMSRSPEPIPSPITVVSKDCEKDSFQKKAMAAIKSVDLKEAHSVISKHEKCNPENKSLGHLKGISKGGTKVSRFEKVGLNINVALLPSNIYDLVTASISLKSGEGHESSQDLRLSVEQLEKEVKDIEHELYEAVNEFKSFLTFVKMIKSEGCEQHLEDILNQILQRMLRAKQILPYIPSVVCMHYQQPPPPKAEDKLSGYLMNCKGACMSLFTYLTIILYAAWKVGPKSVVCLQNMKAMSDPALWATFGVYLQSIDPEEESGVCFLMTKEFMDNIISQEELAADQDKNLRGRCLIVNIQMDGQSFCIANVLSPSDKAEKALFMEDAASFLKTHGQGELIIAGNFQNEERLMKVHASKVVNRHVSLSTLRKFVPFQDVAEYIVYKPQGHSSSDTIDLKVYELCEHFSENVENCLKVKWNNCKHDMHWEDHHRELQPLAKLDTVEVWRKKNPGTIEFTSSEQDKEKKMVIARQNMDYFVSKVLMDHVSRCKIDHDLRVLGFLRHAVLEMVVDLK